MPTDSKLETSDMLTPKQRERYHFKASVEQLHKLLIMRSVFKETGYLLFDVHPEYRVHQEAFLAIPDKKDPTIGQHISEIFIVRPTRRGVIEIHSDYLHVPRKPSTARIEIRKKLRQRRKTKITGWRFGRKLPDTENKGGWMAYVREEDRKEVENLLGLRISASTATKTPHRSHFPRAGSLKKGWKDRPRYPR